MNPRFKKGDIVYVVREGDAYIRFDKIAKYLKATNWIPYKELKNDTEVTVINFGFSGYVYKTDNSIPIYLVKDKEGFEYGIMETGITGWFSYELIKFFRTKLLIRKMRDKRKIY